MSQGHAVYLQGISAYINMRRIKFECFYALLLPVLLFVEVKTIAGLTRAFCSDCCLNVVIDEKSASANLAEDYPTQDIDGAVLPVSSTPYRHIPPCAPLYRRVLIATHKQSFLAYTASHPVAAVLVPPGIQQQEVNAPRSLLFSTSAHSHSSQSRSSPIGGTVAGPSNSRCSAPAGDRCTRDCLSSASSMDTDRDGSPDILEFCDSAYLPLKEFKAHFADCRVHRA
ncbi:hypothetical protein BU17DRAFT_94866 [Hysterangium stoloniferum]|nr:hypothetical protein BU17DRAFT_94866 [Hysterangium stoloniferum]